MPDREDVDGPPAALERRDGRDGVLDIQVELGRLAGEVVVDRDVDGRRAWPRRVQLDLGGRLLGAGQLGLRLRDQLLEPRASIDETLLLHLPRDERTREVRVSQRGRVVRGGGPGIRFRVVRRRAPRLAHARTRS